MSDKDNVGMASRLRDAATEVYAVEPSKARAEDDSSLAAVFDGQGVDATAYGEVVEGVREALGDADEDDAVVVAGSLWTVGEARRLWKDPSTAAAHSSPEEATRWFGETGLRDEPHDTPQRTVRLHDLTHEEGLALERAASRVGCSVTVSGYAPDSYVDAVVTATPQEYRALLDDGIVRKPYDEVFGKGDETQIMGVLNVTPGLVLRRRRVQRRREGGRTRLRDGRKKARIS